MPEWPADYCPACHVPMRLVAVDAPVPLFPTRHTYQCRQCRVILSREVSGAEDGERSGGGCNPAAAASVENRT